MARGNSFFWITLGFIAFAGVSFKCTSAIAEGTDKTKAVVNDSSFRFGFWNLENLFDTRDDSYNDDDFTPNGANHWTKERYKNKLNNLARVINEINPDALGVCEVENKGVLDDLVNNNQLKSAKYGVVHYDSPDERGIDAGFIYKKDKVSVIHSEKIAVELPENDKTRDILYIQVLLKKTADTLHYFVNHWPSRREGKEISGEKRKQAANTLKQFIINKNLNEKTVIITGDFNDNPWDSSVRNVLETCRPGKNANCNLYNISALLNVKQGGSLKHGKGWDLFDQIIVSKNIWHSEGAPHVNFRHYSLQIFAPDWLKQKGGKFAGSPFRTYGGKDYLNGYSDHFPVFAELMYE